MISFNATQATVVARNDAAPAAAQEACAIIAEVCVSSFANG